MSDQNSRDPMLDMFLFETSQLLEQLEGSILTSERTSCFTQNAIHEIFRIMHTIKGSSAMMMQNGISALAHSIEDLFYFLREEKPDNVDCAALSDLVFEGIDFIKVETEKIKNSLPADQKPDQIIHKMKDFLSDLKQNKAGPEKSAKAYKAVLFFEEDCEMENLRAFAVVHSLQDIASDIFCRPEDILEKSNSAESIRQDGFTVTFKSELDDARIREFFMQTVFLKNLELTAYPSGELEPSSEKSAEAIQKEEPREPVLSGSRMEKEEHAQKEPLVSSSQQSIISVSVSKLDLLLDLVGEMVISEAMVIQNPDLKGLELDNFQKAARQLSKITDEIQDIVMSIRMLPLSITFHKMQRIVRDMCKKLDKEIRLEIIGEETEVDKNIIEHISDPLMHLVRNAADHGIEAASERLAKGKPQAGTITLEAKNAGSDVLISIKDDGRGLDKEKILKKAKENNLLIKSPEDMTDREIFNLIFLPGFSTNERITEFSGRGVGMDVVMKNLEVIGGSVLVDSVPHKGTAILLKIPLTLAIIDGMNVKVGSARYTIPTISIKESFRPGEKDAFTDPEGNEMIMLRGECYKILRLHEAFKVKTDVTCLRDGILIMVEQDDKALCLFADELLGQQQVVVKTLPGYIRRFEKTAGLSGCTLLGDGSISLIIDVGGLFRI